METVSLKDLFGDEIVVGSKVSACIQGCRRTYIVSGLRPETGEVVLEPGDWRELAGWVRVVS